MTGRILYIPMNQGVAFHLLTFKLLRISAKAALEKRARHCCFQCICLHILGRRFRRVGDNVLLMRDIEAYLPWGSAKDRYRIDWLTITYKTRHFLVAILPRGISRRLLPKLVWRQNQTKSKPLPPNRTN